MGLLIDPGFGRGELLVTQWNHWERRSPSYLAGERVRQSVKVFPDVDPSITRGNKQYSNEMVTCVAVKNTTANELAVGSEQTVDGFTGVVDEYLSKPVPPTAIFWLVVKGLYSTDLNAEPVARDRADGGAAGSLPAPPADTTIGTVTLSGDSAAGNGDKKAYSAANSGDTSGLTYQWNVDDVPASVENGNAADCLITFGGTGTAVVTCVVGSTDPSVIDGPSKQASLSVTVS